MNTIMLMIAGAITVVGCVFAVVSAFVVREGSEEAAGWWAATGLWTCAASVYFLITRFA